MAMETLAIAYNIAQQINGQLINKFLTEYFK